VAVVCLQFELGIRISFGNRNDGILKVRLTETGSCGSMPKKSKKSVTKRIKLADKYRVRTKKKSDATSDR
jgi:hypothetical protein